MNRKISLIVSIVLVAFTIGILANALRTAWENQRILSHQLDQVRKQQQQQQPNEK